MKNKCIICSKHSHGITYRESFICEDCFDYICGLEFRGVKKQKNNTSV